MTGAGGRPRRRAVLGRLFPLPRPPAGQIREAADGYRLLRSMGSLLLRRATCPSCGKGRLVRREDAASLQAAGAPATGHPVLACAGPDGAGRGCGHVVILDREVSSPAALARGQALFGQARTAFYAAVGVAVAATALGLYLWSIHTLAGGVLVGAFVGAEAAVLRYRAWQLCHGRLFERRAPVAEWLKWEFGSEAGRPGVPGTEPPRRVG